MENVFYVLKWIVIVIYAFHYDCIKSFELPKYIKF